MEGRECFFMPNNEPRPLGNIFIWSKCVLLQALFTELVIFLSTCIVWYLMTYSLTCAIIFFHYVENTLRKHYLKLEGILTSIHVTAYIQRRNFLHSILIKQYSISDYLLQWWKNWIGRSSNSLIEKWKYSKLTQYLSKILLFS